MPRFQGHVVPLTPKGCCCHNKKIVGIAPASHRQHLLNRRSRLAAKVAAQLNTCAGDTFRYCNSPVYPAQHAAHDCLFMLVQATCKNTQAAVSCVVRCKVIGNVGETVMCTPSLAHYIVYCSWLWWTRCTHLTYNLTAPIQHASQNLCSHNQAGGIGVDGNVPSHQSHILKLFIQLTVFLQHSALLALTVYIHSNPSPNGEGQMQILLCGFQQAGQVWLLGSQACYCRAMQYSCKRATCHRSISTPGCSEP